MKSKILAGLFSAIMGFATMNAVAAEWRPLGALEAAHWGATHVVTILESDLTMTGSPIVQTLTNGTISANTTIIPVALAVGQAFNVSAADNLADTNGYNNLTVSVGDSASASQFLASTQIHGNGTNDTLRLIAAQGGTVAMTLQKSSSYTTTTYVAQSANVGTNGESVVTNIVATTTIYAGAVTNATAAFTGSVTGTKAYTAANAFRFAFTGQTNETLAAFTTGRIDFYYREVKP